MSRPVERIAISLIDLNELDSEKMGQVFGGRINTPLKPFMIDETFDGVTLPHAYVELTGDLLGSALACEYLRNSQRRQGSRILKVRINRGRNHKDSPQGVWRLITTTDQLVIRIQDQLCLNPEWFPSQVKVYSEEDTPVPVRITPQSQRK